MANRWSSCYAVKSWLDSTAFIDHAALRAILNTPSNDPLGRLSIFAMGVLPYFDALLQSFLLATAIAKMQTCD
jgi:hypothetical protein